MPDLTIHSERSARLAATADGAVSSLINCNHANLAVDGRMNGPRPMMDASSKELGTQAVPVPLMDAERTVPY